MRPLKAWIPLFLILVLALLPVVRPAWFFQPSEIRGAIQKGLGFYENPDNLKSIRIDDAFLFELLKRIEPTLRSIELPEENRRNYAADPLKRLIDPDYPVPDLRFYRRAYPYQPLAEINNNSYLINPPYETYLRDPYDDILFKALHCDLGTYDEADFAILKSIQAKAGDYADTHYFLGLLLLRENQCFDQERIESEIKTAAADIVKTAEQDTLFSDLYAERIVFLYWAGFGDQVEETWIDRITEVLTADPGWREVGQDRSNAHTTGLALLALRYFESGQAKQDFYAPTVTRIPEK